MQPKNQKKPKMNILKCANCLYSALIDSNKTMQAREGWKEGIPLEIGLLSEVPNKKMGNMGPGIILIISFSPRARFFRIVLE